MKDRQAHLQECLLSRSIYKKISIYHLIMYWKVQLSIVRVKLNNDQHTDEDFHKPIYIKLF